METRIKKVAFWAAAGTAAALIYIKIRAITGFSLICPFHAITGLSCPGCGNTRMVIALTQLDFKAAFEFNQLSFILLPFFLVFCVRYFIRYIRTGKFTVTKFENRLLILVIAAMIIFGILRNLIPILGGDLWENQIGKRLLIFLQRLL